MSNPRFSVAEATTPNLSFAEDLALCRQAGIDGIGIDERKLHDERADVQRLRASGLKAAGFFPVDPSILPLPLVEGPNDPAARTEALSQVVRRAAAFEPACCVCLTGPQGRFEAEEAHELAVTGLREVARVAADVGVTVAIEAIHASIKDDWTMVTTIPEIAELLDEIGDPRIGMAFDVWHLWDTPDVLRHVRDHAVRCVHVHMNDWRVPSRSWCDRVLPGDGVADIRGMLKALDEGGFDGWFDLEVFSDDGRFGNDFPDSLWKLDPLELVQAGRDQFLHLWETRDQPR